MSFWDQFQEVGQRETQPEIAEKTATAELPMIQNQQPIQQNYWSQFQDVQTPETTGESALRQAGGAFLSGVTQLAGLPGDIESLIRSATGTQTEDQFFAPGSKFAEIRKKGFEKFEPKGKREELQQEFAGDVATGVKGVGRRLFVAAAGILGKEGAKELGAGEAGQAGAKIISGILASRKGRPNVKDFMNKEYAKAENAIPKAATIPSKRAETYLNQVKEKVTQGGQAPWKKPVLDQIEALEKNFKNGKIKVTALNQAVKDINSSLAEKSIRGTQADMWLNRVKAATQHELKQYGKTNPEFLKHWKDANASFAGFKQSLIAQKHIDKLKEIGSIKGSVALLAEALYKPEFAAQTVGAIATIYGVKKSGELLHRVFANPVLANYYLKATAAAAKENSKQFIVNMSKLDAALKKEKNQ